MNITIVQILVGITVITSILGWRLASFWRTFVGWPYGQWHLKQWYRLLTHGFLHADVGHLFFNMYTLLSFGQQVEGYYVALWGPYKGTICLLLIYLGGIIAGGLSGFKYRNNPNYLSLGASAGVLAVLASDILYNPLGIILIYFVIPVPAMLYLVGFIIVSYFFMAGQGRINHGAHLWGTAYGVVVTFALEPALLKWYIMKVYAGVSLLAHGF